MTAIVDNFGTGAHPGPDADGMVAVLPCRCCGAETTGIREVCIGAQTETVAYWVYVCRPCREMLDAEIAERRVIFAALVADGISVDLANEVMRRWHGSGRSP